MSRDDKNQARIDRLAAIFTDARERHSDGFAHFFIGWLEGIVRDDTKTPAQMRDELRVAFAAYELDEARRQAQLDANLRAAREIANGGDES